ncbi:unnamed protein product [Schistosoma rodhaini]|uniref:Non-specific serine/threonine protein kinase n=1 Tax=Schistosoma rodhaini TaxID=6188 RepID=A0AA85F0B3_9TREM|nr:unnamed protein product [Schistosoma rodhaini]
MQTDRTFLDLFWGLSARDEKQRIESSNKLVTLLSGKTDEEKTTYFTYTRQRLVKGLKSFEESTRSSYEQCLIRFLKDFPTETSTKELAESMSVQIFASEPSTQNERSSVKLAYLACTRVLCASGRIKEIDDGFAKALLQHIVLLAKSTHHRAAAYLAISEMSLQAPKHLFTNLSCFLKESYQNLMSSNSDITGELLLVILSFQHRFQKRLQKLDIPPFNISEKQYRRKLLFGILHSHDAIVMRLIDEVLKRNVLSTVWDSVKATLCSKAKKVKDTFRFLQIVVHIICNGKEKFDFVLSSDVFEGFSKQLSDCKYGYFPQVSHLLRVMMDKIIGSTNVGEHLQKSTVSMSPDCLLKSIALNYPLFDFFCDSSSPKPCQIIFDSAPSSLSLDTLQLYVKQLTSAFINTEVQYSHKNIRNIRVLNNSNQIQSLDLDHDAIRCFVIKHLQIVVNTILKFRYMEGTELLSQILEFLLTIGLTYSLKVDNTALRTSISTNVAKFCWGVLFGILDCMILQAARINKHSGQETIKNITNMDIIRHCVSLLQNAVPQCTRAMSTRSLNTDIGLCLDSLKRCLKILQKADSEDQLDQYILLTCGAFSVFSLSMPIEDTFEILNDLIECRKRRLANTVFEGPHWSEVLTDVILSALSFPVHMLRSVTRLTFKKMILGKAFISTINSGEEYPSCLKLIGDILKTRSTKQTGRAKHDEDEVDDSETEDLVHFSLFNSTKLVQPKELSIPIDDFEDETAPVEDEEKNANQEGNSQDTSDDSDSDGVEEEIDIDEDELNQIKNSVRDALGPAALDSENNDNNCRDFTDAEMFERDEALAAAFRIHMRKPQRIVADQARSVGELKMKCFDLIECILQYSSESKLVLPALDLVLDIGKGSIEYETAKSRNDLSSNRKINQKKKRKTSFVAKYGDIPPLSSIILVARKLRFRSQKTQSEFIESLKNLDQHVYLKKTVHSLIDAAKTTDSTQLFTELLSIIIEFITFAHKASKLLVETTVKACEKIIDRLNDIREVEINGFESCNLVSLFQIVTHMFKSTKNELKVKKMSRKLIVKLAELLQITEKASQSSVNHNVWYNRLKLSLALFELLVCIVKLDESASSAFLQDDIVKLLGKFPSTQKPIRSAARRFLNLLRENNRKSGVFNESESRQERLRLKMERKKQRQQKRKEKALMKKEPTNKTTGPKRNEVNAKKKSLKNNVNKSKPTIKTVPSPKNSQKVRVLKRKHQPDNKNDNKKRKVAED